MSSEYLNNKFFEKIICEFQNSRREKNRLEILIEDINFTIDRKSIKKLNVIENKNDLLEKQDNYRETCQIYEDSKEK